MSGDHAQWEVATVWGTVWIYAQPGKVGIQPRELGNLPADEALALSRALAAAAEMARAQAAVKDAADTHGPRSEQAEAARAALRRLQASAD